jgi:hypothetical protein
MSKLSQKRIIIIGGMGPQASVELHSRILKGCRYLWRS